MPILKNLRHETFAQARAKGALLDDAFEAAGFVPAKGHPSRLARRPEVAERVAEIRALRSGMPEISTPAMIASLLALAQGGMASDNPAVVKEARLALVDAARLHGEMESLHRYDRSDILNDFRSL